ncbi:MAG: hypothetical protein JWN41_825 [Thermoleophilia bacterium]|nr:hypothetical protein [Thermoleophilia bacterium]
MTTGDLTSATNDERVSARTTTRSTARSVLLGSAGTLVVLALLPVCWFFDISLAGWAIGAAAVAVNRAIQLLIGWLVRDGSLTMVLGAMGFSTVFRALFTALAFFFVGASIGARGDRAFGLDRPDLARIAVVVFIVGFTIDAAIETIGRASAHERLKSAAPTAATPPQEHLA